LITFAGDISLYFVQRHTAQSTQNHFTMLAQVLFLAMMLSSVHSNSVQNHRIAYNTPSGKWEMVKNTEGVQSYVRWTLDGKGNTVRERMGEMIVGCSLQDAVILLSDAESTSKWMSGVSENYLLERISQTEWYTYTLFSIPWPFNKRDLVSWCRISSDPVHETANLSMICKDKFVPLKPGIDRLTDYRANWVITRAGEKIKITFTASSTAPLIFPRLIQDPVIERIFHNNLVRLRDYLSS
jgi:hypothetical protein